MGSHRFESRITQAAEQGSCSSWMLIDLEALQKDRLEDTGAELRVPPEWPGGRAQELCCNKGLKVQCQNESLNHCDCRGKGRKGEE